MAQSNFAVLIADGQAILWYIFDSCGVNASVLVNNYEVQLFLCIFT